MAYQSRQLLTGWQSACGEMLARSAFIIGRGSSGWAQSLSIAVPLRLAFLLSFAGLAWGQPDHAPFTAPSTALPTPSPTEFWVVEPNEGQSAGGHAAIRIGDWLYHVEHRGDGLIADRRTARRNFERIYRGRGNRAISVIPLALTAVEAAALRGQLESRYFRRSRQLDELDALDRQADWLARTQEGGRIALKLPGVGLFADASSCATSEPGKALLRRIEGRHGRGWLEAQRDRAQRQTHELVLEILDQKRPHNTTIPPTEAPKHRYLRALQRLRNSANVWAAYDILLECRALPAERLRVARPNPGKAGATGTPANALAYTNREIESWTRSREDLLERMVELVASPREDLGLPLALGWARLQALDRSVASGALHVVDPFEEAEKNPRMPTTLDGSLPDLWITRLNTAAELRWRSARARFKTGAGPLEAGITDLERSHHDLAHARSGTLHRMPPLPSLGASIATRYASAERVLPWPAEIARDAPGDAFKRVSSKAKTLRKIMTEKLGYQLFAKNCVTELLNALDVLATSTAGPPVAHSPRNPTRLHPDRRRDLLSSDTTGFVDFIRGRFIPVVAGRVVETAYASKDTSSVPKSNGDRITLPSSRDLASKELQASGGTSRLREATTLTAKTYEPNELDSIFLLFSDVPTLARPVIGATNLAYGLSAAGVGVLLAPFDRGETVRRGLQGALMSVPELFFFQVRQGSYPASPPWVPVERAAKE